MIYKLFQKTSFTILFSFLIFFPNYITAQELADALEAYENKQYDIALKSFKKVYKKQSNDTEVNYMFGKCILKANTDRKEAKKYLEIVIGNDINYKDVNLELAKAYMYNFEFDKAQKSLDFFLKNYDFSDEKERSKKEDAKKLFQNIATAKTLIKDSLNVTFNNLGETINSKRSEYTPFITQDGQTLFFTSNNKYDSDLLELISNGFYATFSTEEEGQWSKMKSLGKEVNSSENEMIIGLSKDEKKVIINVDWMDDKGDLFITSKEKKKYVELSELEKTVNSIYDERSGSFTKNEDTLYFCSNRPGGFGGQDLYMSVKLPDNTWGKPINLGPEINTEYNETFPIISIEGNSMNFSSDRPQSMGGYDVFKVDYINHKWSNIRNIGYPLNNFYDNFTITYSKSKRYGYIDQIRPEGYGGSDIYQVIINDITAQNIVYTGTIKKANGSETSILEEPITIKAYTLADNRYFAKSNYSKSGKYTFAFPPGEYKILITGSSFAEYEQKVRIPENEPTELIITKNILVQ